MQNDLLYLILDKNFNVTYIDPVLKDRYRFFSQQDFFKNLLGGYSAGDFKEAVRFAMPPMSMQDAELIFAPYGDGLICYVVKSMNAKASDAAKNLRYQLREPISGIFAMLPVIADDIGRSDTERAVQNLESVYRQTYRLLRSVNNLSAAASAMYGRQTGTDLCDFSELLDELLASVRLVVKDIEINSEIQPGLCVRANYTMICSALLNLISNSINYKSDEAVKIIISLHRDEKNVIFSYSDNSKGIKEEYQPFVFQPYFSKDPYNDGEADPSLGMGLFIAKCAFEQADGRILLSSKFGAGVRYTVSMPRAKPDGRILESRKTDFLLNKYSPLFVQLYDCCLLPGL